MKNKTLQIKLKGGIMKCDRCDKETKMLHRIELSEYKHEDLYPWTQVFFSGNICNKCLNEILKVVRGEG